MKTERLPTVAASLALFLAPLCAAAQDSEEAMLQEAHDQFVEAVTGMDFERLGNMFAEGAVYQPATGELLQGREEIREWYEQANFTSMNVEGTYSERLGDDMLLDLGSFSATVSRGEQDQEIRGGYVTVAEIDGDSVLIRSLTAFPERNMQMPPAN